MTWLAAKQATSSDSEMSPQGWVSFFKTFNFNKSDKKIFLVLHLLVNEHLPDNFQILTIYVMYIYDAYAHTYTYVI